MPISLARTDEPYSLRVCRCGQVMRPTESSDRRWCCPACGRKER